MKFSLVVAGLVSLLAPAAEAHMEITYPPPFRSRYNQYTTDIDYSMTNPLSSSGSDFPCKGYHSLMGTSQGQSVATWRAGGTYSWTITGSATHNGGSCQASLSFDRGATWKVVQSYIGNCPLKSSWPFTLPNDTPAGSALFAWSWWNQVGNREMYMNCAHVTISRSRDAAGIDAAEVVQEDAVETDEDDEEEDVDVAADEEATAAGIEERGPNDSINSRPAMFVANVGKGCSTLELYDVLFPNPGPDVINESSKTARPVGNC